MEARHLRYAQALAEHRHFGRAAAALGIAQPPLSSQIAALEREVGERLFDRTPKGVFPTAAGTAFLARARSALDEMGGAVVDAGRAARGETGRLRLGFIGSALLAPLPGCSAGSSAPGRTSGSRHSRREPRRGVAGLLAGELDVAVGRGAPRGPGAEELVTVPIGTDDLVAAVAVTHPFAGTRSVTIEQLAGERLVVSGRADEPGVGAWLQTVFADAPTALDGAADRP
ncbi:LysR family transcriptional regulator [Pseudonocardia sp. ICBG601]|uniref:LysR family transcriptional regulator n=1 Tax=Pseudonocardia sp. ICBG601 TaxID=2846759 RepID=UPI001CF64FD7|nr:LysR family transcriptional regulator [Pseudonocardia sp. ICBG601]